MNEIEWKRNISSAYQRKNENHIQNTIFRKNMNMIFSDTMTWGCDPKFLGFDPR